jgi:outer membrane lipoprotein LolB
MWPFEGLARRGRLIVLPALAVVSLLAGCASVVPPRPEPVQTRPAEGPREWAGRFSVRLVNNDIEGRQDAATGRFSLTALPSAEGRTLELEVLSPFGQTMATGRRLPDGAATLVLSDGRTLRAASLDGLLEQALGWPLPIERLPDWLDDRFETVIERDPQGRVSAAADSGWQIEREPRRWTLQRPRPDGQLRVVLLLDR